MDKDKRFLWAILATVLLGLIIGGFLYVNTSHNKPSQSSRVEVPQLETDLPLNSTDANEVAGAVVAESVAAPNSPPASPNIIYNPPKEMTLGETKRVEVRITNKKLSKAVFEADLQGEGEIKSNQILTDKFMSVELCCGETGAGHPFDITALSQTKQIVGLGDFTQWAFDVKPQKKGTQSLNLKVTVHQSDGIGGFYSIPVMTDKIEVKVDTVKEVQAWLSQHWQWLGLLLLIPMLVFYVTRSLKGKKRAALSGNESVFISYRRDDSSGYTLAIYQKLKDALGDDKVFMDLDDIPHGVDFSEHLDKVLANASTVMVMIGENWLNATNEHGRRLDNPNDYVRMEIATALERNIRVIPVLLKNAQMPRQQELPEVLATLSKRNGIRIYDDQFDASIERLLESIG